MKAATSAGKQAPRLSIITVSLNQGQYLEECLQSVRGQTCPDIEHIVMDGGSTDHTLDLLRQHERECPFPLQWRSEPDRGQSHAYNKAFELARGEWILYLNSSDYLLSPDSLERAFAAAAAKPGYDMYAFSYRVRHLGQKPGDKLAYHPCNLMMMPEGQAGEVSLRKYHKNGGILPHEATLIRRELVERAGGYDEEFKCHMDEDFFCRALKFGPAWMDSGCPIAVFRFHADAVGCPQVDGDRAAIQRSEWERYWARRRTGAPVTGSHVWRYWRNQVPPYAWLKAQERFVRRRIKGLSRTSAEDAGVS